MVQFERNESRPDLHHKKPKRISDASLNDDTFLEGGDSKKEKVVFNSQESSQVADLFSDELNKKYVLLDIIS